MQKLRDFFINKEWILVVCLVLVFVLVRLPGTNQPLHQDEYKWPRVVDPASVSGVSIPHPPLSQFIYRTAGYIVGFDADFRFIPLFFGAINLVLLFYLIKFMFGRREAFVASIIWIFSFFSVLASLMVDTDGQIMPFFFLLALIGYFKLESPESNNRYGWFFLMLIGLVSGVLLKLSFVLAVGAIVADFLWTRRKLMDRKIVVRYVWFGLSSLVGMAVLILLSKIFFPFFNLETSVKYWEHFIVFDRGWFQTMIQVIKAILFTSPFLVMVPFFIPKEIFHKIRVFIFFFIFAFIFYIVLFDFSIGALDRYLQLLVLPLTIMTSVVITPIIFTKEKRKKEFLLLGIAVAFILILLQSLPHYVPPLHPKAEWITRILSLKWNFVYPFSGGSGPLGFYVSFLFMSLSWVISLVVLVFAKIRPQYKKLAIIFIIPIGMAYNGVFIEEYLFGYWNGNSSFLVRDASAFIIQNPDIKKVTVYNDNGGDEILRSGKYRKRLYVDPKFDINEKVATLNKYKEHYLVIDVPRIDPTSAYQKYFNSCKVIYNKIDKKISATIYDCQDIPDLKL